MRGRPHKVARASLVFILPFIAACGGEDDGGESSNEGTGGATQTSNDNSTNAGGTNGDSGGSNGESGGSNGDASGGSGGSSAGSGGSGDTSGGSGGASSTETGTVGGAGGSTSSDNSSTENTSTTGGSSANTGPWEDVTNNLTTIASGGLDISALEGQPGTERVIVGVGERGLFATDDGGGTWFALGQGSGSETIPNRPLGVIFDPDDSTIFWENGSYGPGVFFTSNNGDTFTRLGTIDANDLVSIDFTDPDRRTLLAGSHEREQLLWLSTDAGANWTDIGPQLPGGIGYSGHPLVLDSETFLLGTCISGGGGQCGVYRSQDQGSSWTNVSSDGPGSNPLVASNGFIYWQLAGRNGIIVSQDDGETWSKAPGPVQSRTASAFELPDGRIVALGETQLQISSDHGASWSSFGEPMPAPGQNCGIYGMTYSIAGKALYINQNDCSGHVENGFVYRAEFDYEAD